MNSIDQLKQKDLLEYIQKTLGDNGKKENDGYRFKSGKKDKTPSLLVYKDNSKGYYDYSGRLGGGTIIDFEMNFHSVDNGAAIKNLCKFYNIVEEKQEMVKCPKRAELFENFEQFRMTGLNSGFTRFLRTRGIELDDIVKYKDRLNEVAKEFGFSQIYIGDKQNKDVILFPCSRNNKRVGVKFRRTDGEPIPRGPNYQPIKEYIVKDQKTGVHYGKIDKNLTILCEGPPDYIILRMLGFDNAFGNFGGVAYKKFKKDLKDVKEIISFYDNDPEAKKENGRLCKELGRPIRAVNYKEIAGKSKYDINDLYIMGYREKDFQELLDGATFIEPPEEGDENDVIIEKEDGYYITKIYDDAVKEIKITNFKISIEDIIEHEDGNNVVKILTLKLTDGNKTVFGEFHPKHVADVKGFKTVVKGLETSFSTYDMRPLALEGLLRYIHIGIDIKSTKVIDKKGYIPEFNTWVFNEGVIFDKKFIKFNELNVVDIGKIKLKLILSTKKNLPLYQEDDFFDENIKDFIIGDLRHMFGGVQGDLVLGFLIASLFVNTLKSQLKPFPILFVSGKARSGKTEGVTIALRILGIEDSVSSAEEDNVFVDQFEISESSSIARWSDEFKNGKKTKEKNGFYKNVFDRNGAGKGTLNQGGLGSKSLKVESYPINATLILSGEQTPKDDALFSRICLINVSGKREGENIYDDIVARSGKYGSIIRLILENHNFNDLALKFEKIFNALRKKLIKDFSLEKRILNVYLPIIAGFFFYNSVVLGKNFIEDEFVDKWFKNIKEHVGNKKKREQESDIVETFFGTINDLYSDYKGNGICVTDEFIKVTKGGVQIFYTKLYALFQKEQKRIDNIEAKSTDLKAYMIDEYGAKESKMKISYGKRENSLRFDQNNLPENLAIIVEFIENWKDPLKNKD